MDDYIFKKFYQHCPTVQDVKISCGFTWQTLALKMGVTVMTLWRWGSAGNPIPLEGRMRLVETMDRYGGKQ